MTGVSLASGSALPPSSFGCSRADDAEEPHRMQEIRDAILSGDRIRETYAGLPIPESYRAVTVHKDEVEHVRGHGQQGQGPAQSRCTSTRCRCPSSRPGEALVAVMASAINYNTVWTSIFEPVSTFGFLERYGRTSRVRQAARPALPRGRLRPGRRRAAHRPRGDQVEARRARSSRTACRSSSRTPTATTTRCSTRSSGSGASRPTSAASPSWPSSSPTS